ncbi:hypothetical protein Ccrd_022268, partial [Cynara cardunculus var. scolymus]
QLLYPTYTLHIHQLRQSYTLTLISKKTIEASKTTLHSLDTGFLVMAYRSQSSYVAPYSRFSLYRFMLSLDTLDSVCLQFCKIEDVPPMEKLMETWGFFTLCFIMCLGHVCFRNAF